MFFGNNSSAVRRIQISLTGLLLRTTRRARLHTKRFDLQGFRQEVGVDGQGKQSMRHDIFSRGSRGGLGLDFVGKIPPSEMHGKIVTNHILF